jgi:outer membrane protein OmpU
MKKVLLATSALFLTAGVASAEVSFSGKGQVSATSTAGADNVLNTHIDFNVAVSGAADNGMTFSTSFGYDAGREADYNDDYQLDAAETGWGTGAPEIAISYNGVTLKAQNNGVDNLFDDAAAEDLGLSGSFAGVSYAVTSHINGADSSYKLGYTMGDVTASIVGTNVDAVGGDATKVSVSYKMGDVTLSASSQNERGTAEDDNTVGIAYTMGAVSVSYTAIEPGSVANGNLGDEWDLKVSFAQGAVSGYVTLDEADTTHMVAEYDLGGATAFVSSTNTTQAANAGDFTAMGVSFAF